MDQDACPRKSYEDNKQPQESNKPPICRYVGQTMYSGGLKEFLESLHIGIDGLIANEILLLQRTHNFPRVNQNYTIEQHLGGTLFT